MVPHVLTASTWFIDQPVILGDPEGSRSHRKMTSILAEDMGGSWNRGTPWYPQIIHFSRIVHYKPSSYWGTPLMETAICSILIYVVLWFSVSPAPFPSPVPLQDFKKFLLENDTILTKTLAAKIGPLVGWRVPQKIVGWYFPQERRLKQPKWGFTVI